MDGMDIKDRIKDMIPALEDRDNSKAYRTLLELEQLSEEADLLYSYTEKFADMTRSDKYAVRVRGFRLFCKQAKWDKENILDENIDGALHILKDDKPTAVRQALAALKDVVRYKPELREAVRRAVSAIPYLRYKETMHHLIAEDIGELLEGIRKAGERGE